jgi:GDP-4-dehydro-6-deoxy-D-mannose reductase
MTRTLITGASGFAGRHLVAHLRTTTDWELWALGRSSQPDLDTITADLLDREAVARAVAQVQPDIVVHLAAQSFVPASFDDPATTFNTNVIGQLHLLQAIAAANINPLVLVVSSNEVYGMVQPDEIPVNEKTPLRPPSPYAVSKAAQDLLAGQWFYSHKLRIIRVRPFNHIGPGQKAQFAAPAFARQIARIERGLQPPIVKVGNLEAQRDFTDVRDIVRAYHLALVHGEPGAIYNVGAGEPVAMRTILETLINLSAVPIAIESDPARMRPADVPTVTCDARYFQARTGWQRQYTLDQTLRDVLEDWRSRIQHEDPDLN